MRRMKVAVFVLALAGCFAAEQKFGQAFTLKESVPVSKIMEAPDNLVNKTVQVKGKVTEVCQMMGCWMSLVDPATGQALRIKVVDGEISFPKESVGRMAVAEGTLKKFVLSKEQTISAARHEAEEQGRKFDPASIKDGKTIYQIQGTGAVLLD